MLRVRRRAPLLEAPRRLRPAEGRDRRRRSPSSSAGSRRCGARRTPTCRGGRGRRPRRGARRPRGGARARARRSCSSESASTPRPYDARRSRARAPSTRRRSRARRPARCARRCDEDGVRCVVFGGRVDGGAVTTWRRCALSGDPARVALDLVELGRRAAESASIAVGASPAPAGASTRPAVLLDERPELPEGHPVGSAARVARSPSPCVGAARSARSRRSSRPRRSDPALLAADGHARLAASITKKPTPLWPSWRSSSPARRCAPSTTAASRSSLLRLEVGEERNAPQELDRGSIAPDSTRTGRSRPSPRRASSSILPVRGVELLAAEAVELLAALPERERLVEPAPRRARAARRSAPAPSAPPRTSARRSRPRVLDAGSERALGDARRRRASPLRAPVARADDASPARTIA